MGRQHACVALLMWLMCVKVALATTAAYHTNFRNRTAVLAEWYPQEECTHCDNEKDRNQCTNMTLSATSFDHDGMTHTTRAGNSSAGTACPHFTDHVCSSGHMTWRPSLRYGNFSILARFFPGTPAQVNTSTAFIGLDSASNSASITMGFHGAGWLGNTLTPAANKTAGPHQFQTGVYCCGHRGRDRGQTPAINTAEDMSTSFNRYGLLWTPDLVEWRFNGAVVLRFTNKSNIPSERMQLRLHTRSGYCDRMPAGTSFNATFKSFSYTPYTSLMS